MTHSTRPSERVGPGSPWDGDELGDLDRFTAVIAEMLGRDGDLRLQPDTQIGSEFDSLEWAIVSAFMANLRADLPPGIEGALDTMQDLYEHAQRRREGERSI